MQWHCTSESQEQEQQDHETVKTKKPPPLREVPNRPYQEGIEFCDPSYKLL